MMRTIYVRIPKSILGQVKRKTNNYRHISRRPLNEICTRAIYWGGVWGLLLEGAPRSVPGKKATVAVQVPELVAEDWDRWLSDYGIGSAYAIAYLCTVMYLPPIPLDWELGAVAVSTWYRDRSVLRLVPEAKPRWRKNVRVIDV